MEKEKLSNEGKLLDLSIVIPVYNEEENILPLYQRLKDALSQLNQSYEIIWINDGSSDGSLEMLKKIHQHDRHIKIISFRRNFGQTAALSAGFDYARGEIIMTFDSDLQNDPEDIKKLMDKMKEGYDLVSGWRYDRKEPFLTRRLPSQMANFLISHVSKVKLHDYGCTLKAYRQDVVKSLNLYGEMHRFIPALASIRGITFAEIKVKHHPRTKGKSKYGISRTMRVLLDLFTVKFLMSFSTRPMQIFGLMGVIFSFLGFVIALYLSVLRLFFQQSIAGRPLLLLAILLIILGFQFISLGLLGEMMVRTHHETQEKPIYVVKEVLE